MKAKTIFLLAFSLLFSALFLFGAEKIKVTAAPLSGQAAIGQTIDVPVNVDMSATAEKLGSYTIDVSWDTQALQYLGYSGGAVSGFENPVVNEQNAARGRLRAAHAYPYGAEGVVNILNLKFQVVGDAGAKSSLSVSFTAMAAARSFTNLLPQVEIAESALEVTSADAPESYGIENFPNPFNPATEIRYQLPKESKVEIVVFNVLGQKVQTLVNGKQAAGRYTIRWEGTDAEGQVVPSGMYFLRMKADQFKAERKLMLLK
ncbi:MAG: T9SS type A sorting domain-containing protein [Calditrichia bacterium]|nr:T9SS type A sorting domain-containing protein [Calditrichia bacterium]